MAGVGLSPAEAFEQAGVALTAVMLDPAVGAPRGGGRDSLRGAEPSLELLFVDWLNALVYEMATRRMIFGRFQVNLDGDRLIGRAWGERLDRRRHRLVPMICVKG